MGFQINKLKKYWWLAFGLLLTACFNPLNQTVIAKGNGLRFSSQLTLFDGINLAFKNPKGFNEFSSALLNKSLTLFYQDLANENGLLKGEEYLGWRQKYAQILAQNNQTNQQNLAMHKKQYPNAADLYKNIYDPNGGSEAFYLQNQNNRFFAKQFENDLFNQLFLLLKDSQQNTITNPGIAALNLAFQTQNPSFFAFGGSNPLENQLAMFQQYLFDQWVVSEIPLVVNKVEWKYDASFQQLESVYQQDALGLSLSKPSANPSYNFPLFNTIANNNQATSLQRFQAFVTQAKDNYQNAQTRFIEIDPNFNSDSNQPTKFLVSLGQGLQNALLSTPLMATIVSLFNNNNFFLVQKAIQTNNTTFPFDKLLANFLTNTPTDGYLKIPMLEANKFLKTNLNSDLYVTDALHITNEALNKFALVRDMNGVSALALDDKQRDLATRKKVLLYYALIPQTSSQFKIDLKQQLLTFFQNNKQWLIWDFIKTNPSQKIFRFDDRIDSFLLSDNNQSALKQLMDQFSLYNQIQKNNQRIFHAQKALYDYKQPLFNKPFYQNGLASFFPFVIQNANDVASFSHFEMLEVLKPFTSKTTTNQKQAYQALLNQAKLYLNQIKNQITPQNNPNSGYIATNNFFLNQLLLGAFSDGDFILKQTNYQLLSEKLLDSKKLKWSFNKQLFDQPLTKQDLDIQFQSPPDPSFNDGLKNALADLFFSTNPTFLTYESNNPFITLTKLPDYRQNIWLEQNEISNINTLDANIAFLELWNTIVRLQNNNMTEFFKQLQNDLMPMQTNFLVFVHSDQNQTQLNQVINMSDSVNINVNATFQNPYWHFQNQASLNTDFRSLVSDNKHYWQFIAQKGGFVGLVNKNINYDQLTSFWQNRLFNNFLTKGALFTYASDLTSLQAYVTDNLTPTNLTPFLITLSQLLPNISFRSILTMTDLTAQKQALKMIIENNKSQLMSALTPYNGLFATDPIFDGTYYHNAYLIQLNMDQVKDQASFINYLTQTVRLSTSQAYEILAYLLVQFASQQKNQEPIKQTIEQAKKNQTYYDDRFKNAA